MSFIISHLKYINRLQMLKVVTCNYNVITKSVYEPSLKFVFQQIIQTLIELK